MEGEGNFRIKKAYEYLKREHVIRNQQHFTECIGSDKSTVSQVLNGKINAPNNMFASVAAAFPQLNMNWVLTGEGEMLNPDTPEPEKSFTEGVPYYDVDFLLGFDELEHPGAQNPECLIRMPGYDKATMWCNASGHSMEPEISNGDIIALKRIEDVSFLPYGDVYGIITTNGMRTIKRLGRSSRDGYYRLIPTNKEYDEQEIPLTQIAVVYRVMGAMKAF